ncbi:hypothetical protein HID58_029214 [Brassica napus]|uniref:Uncharacterized protein n=1 Tax=Brassica napus TaxID=3708 RepID=A0ABQ8CE20_BRANA|nr:hypothetical protein HID58_029214 [Brassica napus]
MFRHRLFGALSQTSSCPNHSRFTMLQSPPLSQARTAIFTAAVVKPSKNHRNREMLGRSVGQSKI